MNKKGLLFATMSIIIIIVFFVSYNIDRTVKEKSAALDKLGVVASASINSVYEGERLEYFIEKSAEYSVLNSVIKMGENGGVYDKDKCDVIDEYVIWDENCKLNLNEDFEKYFDDNFNRYLESVNLDSDDFNLDVSGNLIVKGEKDVELGMAIGGSEVVYDVSKSDNEKIRRTLENLKVYDGIWEIIKKYSEEYNVPEDLILAVIVQESEGKQGAVSEVGCRGLMQICLLHEKYFDGRACNGKTARDSVDCNVKAGAEILRGYYDVYKQGRRYKCGKFCDEKGNCQNPVDKWYSGWGAALRGYNGWGCKGYPDFGYVEKVLKWYEMLGGMEIKKLDIERIGTYYVKPKFEINMEYNFDEDYDSVKRVAEVCLYDEECNGNDVYDLVKYELKGDGVMVFEFRSKEKLNGIRQMVVRFGLRIEEQS